MRIITATSIAEVDEAVKLTMCYTTAAGCNVSSSHKTEYSESFINSCEYIIVKPAMTGGLTAALTAVLA